MKKNARTVGTPNSGAKNLTPGNSTIPKKTKASREKVMELLQEAGVEPVSGICDVLRDYEEYFNSVKDKLTFNQTTDYYRLRVSILERQQAYIYARMPTEHRREDTKLSVNYTDFLKKMDEKMLLETDEYSKKVGDSIDKYNSILVEKIEGK